jgi:SRSO17 transposase
MAVMGRQHPRNGEERFFEYHDELASVLDRRSRVRPMRDYCSELLLSGARKSVKPVATPARRLVGGIV